MTSVLVYGAYGHTGRFVVTELRERGFEVVLSGRDAAKLPGGRPAPVDDPAALDRALGGVSAVINCAVASGRDIYAVSAPLAVEAVERILASRTRTKGVATAGEIFDAQDFLHALTPCIELVL
ncbi:NAD(P)H-binding protein [Amycolatopsis sp. OK19-0408]|uniref:NAD(P)H-binding protein n=1 Tax=Amycolatopsis iheyensis TaxID=2945988 RepID=A0A9X2NN14_9PSEU|nr:NAD(P)H-binding protein [Amycolatopsis iheyensis]MCR6490806.1 NAD(P)H-binding protein [Amycolatopsis iheyensis]